MESYFFPLSPIFFKVDTVENGLVAILLIQEADFWNVGCMAIV